MLALGIKQNMLIKNKKVQLSEIFTSIEGEGIFFGTKTMFIRMAGCHLKCYWCDTDYALSMNSGKCYSINEVKKMIKKKLTKNTYKINFTGGEPLIQYDIVKDLARFVKEEIGLRTYLESSCYDFNRFGEVLPYFDICKIEFKMKDSNVVEKKYYSNLLKNEMECLKMAINSNKITFVKIVVSKYSNFDEFKELIDNIFHTVCAQSLAGFIIQPTTKIDEPTVDSLLKFYDLVYPKYNDVRIIPQLHKVIGAS
ncbi:MAG: 7-carboxy-7-deazaguanine synthase QueE [Nitrososphaeraceae archaeon]|nr:7-carboxy-7-deazaguanine synthase QueE [Nitrososphaeraceae archaeon]